MKGPCAKQVVTATIITPSGGRFVGTNHCENAQPTCPRASMPSGVGYELCVDICQQSGHAEVNAIRASGGEAVGGVLYLEGHTYACSACQSAAAAAGVAEIVIGMAPEAP